MATKGFFTKRTTEAGYILFNFSNNLDVAEVILSFDVSVVDSEGSPAPSVIGSSSIVSSGTKVQVWVEGGDDGETYTYTVDVETNELAEWSLQVDMAVDDDASYEDQLVTLLAAIAQTALETTAQAIKDKTDNLPEDPATAGQLDEIQMAQAAMQADLNNPDQYKADVSSLALEATAQSIKGKTDTLPARPADQASVETYVAAQHTATQGLISGEHAVLDDKLVLIKAKTDSLPSDPASQSDVETAITNTEESLAEDIENLQATADSIETKTTAIQAKTDTINWTDVDFIKAIEGGRWKIESNQMVFYDADNITEVARFDLKNKQGVAADTDVFERTRVT